MINLSLNKKIIIFGFIFTFFSSFGQSFFLGLFNAPIRNELGITHGKFGSIYAVATIFSSLLFIWAGKKIDDFRLLNYSFYVIILLFFSALIFSFINSVYFQQINDGKVSSEYNKFWSLSTFMLIWQVYIAFNYLKAHITLLYDPQNTSALKNKKKMNSVSYLVTPLNIILLGIMNVILEFFSTDG